jgi:hypothetical protein
LFFFLFCFSIEVNVPCTVLLLLLSLQKVAALEDRLAYQIHELEDGSSLATPSQSATAANPNEGGKANGLELPSDSDDDDDIVAFTP